MRRVLAPAKLTVSLRVTGVRPDGYHELDAEMVTLSLADELRSTRGGPASSSTSSRGCGPTGCRDRARTWWSGRWPPVAARAAVRLTKRIPLGGGLGGGSADAAAVLRWAGCTDPDVAVRLGADVPFCLVGGPGPGRRGGGEGHPPPVRGPGLPAAPAALRRGDGPGLPGLGRGSRRRGAQRAHRRRRWPSSPAWHPGATPWGSGPGASRCWPGAARRGSSRSAGTRPGRQLPDELRVGAETARLVRARTVPAGWEGD